MAAELKKRLVEHVVIDVHAAHAYVSRFIETPCHDIQLQAATNATDLEQDALVALERLGESIRTMSRRHACPPDLAARAR